jgi:hypothetical protein
MPLLVKTRVSYVALAGVGFSLALGLGIYSLFRAGPTPSPVEKSLADEVVLGQDQREYIWQVEHHALLLSKFWFHELADALAENDKAGLTAMLDKSFTAQVLRQGTEEKLACEFVQITRVKDAGYTPTSLDAGDFVALLLDFRKPFVGVPRVKVYPKTLAPETPANLDGVWQGTGVVRIWGEAGQGRPREVVLQCQFTLSRPRKEKAAGWLHSFKITQTQVASAPRFLLRDASKERGIDPALYHDNWIEEKKISVTGGVHVCDFNRDGYLDLLIVDAKRIALYKGLSGGRFEDVTVSMGLPAIMPPGSSAGAVFVDLDGDGWEDLILGPAVYRNNEGRGFIDKTLETNLAISPDVSGLIVGDYDRDGKMDIYVTLGGKGKADSWLDGHSGRERGNQLWRNLGNWKFEEVSHKTNTSGGFRSVFSAVFLDINNDGWPDIYVPNEFGKGILLINNGDGTFREHELTNGPGDFGTMGITCGDINNDGHIDLYMANMYSKTGARIVSNLRKGTYSEDIMAKIRRFVSGSQLYVNHGNLKFQPVAQDWQINDVGWAYGPALADLDNDGYLDIFATSGFMSVSRTEPDG